MGRNGNIEAAKNYYIALSKDDQEAKRFWGTTCCYSMSLHRLLLSTRIGKWDRRTNPPNGMGMRALFNVDFNRSLEYAACGVRPVVTYCMQCHSMMLWLYFFPWYVCTAILDVQRFFFEMYRNKFYLKRKCIAPVWSW